MALQDISPTEDDFEQTDWQGVVESADAQTCDTYAGRYAEKARQAAQEGELVASQVFDLMGHVCSLTLDLDSAAEPLGPVLDFRDCHLATLESIVANTADPELRARIADILWCYRRGGHRMAELAVRSYLESADVLEDPENWHLCAERMERSLGLAASLGRKNQPFKEVIAHIERVLDKYQGEDPLLLSARLMGMLQDHGQGDPERYSSLAEKAALRAENEELGIKWHKARGCWTVKARWHEIQGDDESARECKLRVAETFVREAKDKVAQQAPGSYLSAASDIERAIECLSRVMGTKHRREELHKELSRYQKKAVEQFRADTLSIDVTEAAREAAGRVRGKPLFDALLALALMPLHPQAEKLRARVREFAGKYFFAYFPPARQFSQDGRVVARRTSLYAAQEEGDHAFRAEMFKQARNDQGSIAHAVIEPALAQIQREHAVRESDVLTLIQYSPFVPSGREHLYARGIHAGFHGDLVTALHVLCPQVEHSIRRILYDRGVPVWGLKEDGTQDVHSLTSNLSKPQLVEVFGEDIVFDLQGLLVERFGSNLRNQIAHGLVELWEIQSWNALYFWWLVLRLCLAPLYGQLYSQADSGEGDGGAEDGQDDESL